MSHLTIKSILNPSNIRYTSSDHYEGNLLTHSFGKYETLGDGECQHTPTYRIGAEDFTDFCLSLAQFLLDNPDAPVRSYQVGLDAIPDDCLAFLKSVTYSDTKRRYFSMQLRKVSSTDAKRHDKRWIEVPTWADGTIKSAIDLYWQSMDHSPMLLRRYFVLYSFQEFAGGHFCGQDSCETWTKNLTGDHYQAFRALVEAVGAHSKRDWAKRLIESATGNTKRQADAKAEAA